MRARRSWRSSGPQRPQAITDFRRILDDKDVDALFCEAPNHWHGPATILACAAGKHVYVEKPCSHNPWEGEQMIAAARKHNRAVQMGSQRRSTPGVIEAMAKLHDGVIGNVYCAELVQQQPGLARDRQADRPAGDPRLRTLAGSGPAHALSRQPHPLQLALVLALGQRRARQQRDPRPGPVPVGAGRGVPHRRRLLRRPLPLPRRPADARHPRRQFRVPGRQADHLARAELQQASGLLGVRHVLRRQGGALAGQFGDYKVYDADDKLVEDRPDDAKRRESLAGDRHVPRRRLRRDDPQRRPLRR